MATYYSDHYSSDGISKTAREITFPSRGKGLSKSFKIMPKVTALPTTSDVVRLFSISSSCRMPRLLISDNNASAAGAMNIGLYKSEGLGGAVIDADLFAAALARDTALTDALTQAANVTKVKRDLFLWEMAAITVATITKDPVEVWDVCLTPSTSFTTTASIILVEAEILLGS